MSKGKVLIDGDIIAYRAAFATQGFTARYAEEKVDSLMNYIFDETIELPFPHPTEYQTYLTGKTNFRHDIAKSHPYKGNRNASEKPEHLGATRQHLVNGYNAIISDNEEADDLISKAAAELNYDCTVASVDKDMLQIPCWHFNFVKGEWTKVDEWSGIKFFYTQILTGDAADNIKGLHRVGPKTSEKMLAHCETEEDLWETCVKAYDGDTERVIENARLLWLRRYEDQLWEPPQGA